jgi:cyclopropane fatty-acyl-phospholipid synthase-like methyltransferase
MTRLAIDYDTGAPAYRAARTLPEDVLAVWRDAVVGVGLAPAVRVADIGSGTGQFLRPLAEWLGGTVVGTLNLVVLRRP